MNHPHFHITATADDGARAEHQSGAYLPALALARRLVQEAHLSGGIVTFDPMNGDAPNFWMNSDTPWTSSILTSGVSLT